MARRIVKLGSATGACRYESLRTRFLDFYRAALAVHTRLFEGFDEVLDHRAVRPALGRCDQQARLADRPLLARPRTRWPASSPATRCRAQAAPAAALHAAACWARAADCVYVGDAERDVQAARNAGMIPLVAGFGYLGDGEDPAAWQPEAVFARPEELIDWLELGK